MGGKVVPLQKYIRCSARPSASLRLLKKGFSWKLKGNREGTWVIEYWIGILFFASVLKKDQF